MKQQLNKMLVMEVYLNMSGSDTKNRSALSAALH